MPTDKYSPRLSSRKRVFATDEDHCRKSQSKCTVKEPSSNWYIHNIVEHCGRGGRKIQRIVKFSLRRFLLVMSKLATHIRSHQHSKHFYMGSRHCAQVFAPTSRQLACWSISPLHRRALFLNEQSLLLPLFTLPCLNIVLQCMVLGIPVDAHQTQILAHDTGGIFSWYRNQRESGNWTWALLLLWTYTLPASLEQEIQQRENFHSMRPSSSKKGDVEK